LVKFVQKKIGCEEALDLPRPEAPALPVVLVAAAAIIDIDGRVLLAQRPDGKAMEGLWEFPGGKVDEGETPEFALMRELEEELGIITRPCCFSPVGFASHSYESFHLLMPLFVCRVWKGNVVPQENQQVKWVRPSDIYNYQMPEADLPLVGVLQELL
jgi:8-oxo-dGTP diphosphatase